jgi:GntR family transcriptional regulator / MocR family aminotransferase
MAKVEIFQDLLLRPKRSDIELWRWLYTELRAAILDGRLKPGARLPSTRNLANQYSLSRGTVVAAFNQLQAEGYTSSEISAGTFVRLTSTTTKSSSTQVRPVSRVPASKGTLSKRADELLRGAIVVPGSRSIGKAFRSWEPALDLFPVELWARVASRVHRNAPRSLYGQGDPAGYPPLRRAIAEYVGQARGVRCTAEQILVTAGAQQAFDLAGRLLLDPGDEVWMEDPGYPGARQALRGVGGRIIPVPVDEEGLNVAAARKLSPKARMAYVTPANQFPLGIVMSAKRRLELLSWAAQTGAWIIEDEYDAEYRYFGKPIASLQSMDQAGSVIYVGTFTKMLFNALRLGFMVVPERLMTAFEIARSFVDRHPATLQQAVLAEFITEGHFGHHVRKMRHIYSERLQVLKETAESSLPDTLEVDNAAAGMRTIAWLKTNMPDRVAAEGANRLGLELSSLSSFAMKHNPKPGLILGFAGCNPSEIKRGVSMLAVALRTKGRSQPE